MRIPPPSATVPLPFQGRLFLSGSLEKGAGSRRLTEGLLHRSFTPSRRFHREPLHQLRWFPFPEGKAYYQITPRTDIVTTFVRGFFCPNRKTPCWRKAGCREEYADNTTLRMVPPMKLSMEWNGCAAKFNGNNAFWGDRLVEINVIFPRSITLVGE